MTIPNPTDAPTLLTDADVLARVRTLVGPACVDRQLWIMLVDGDGRQAPVVMPVSAVPRRPVPRLLDGLAEMLRGLADDLTTDLGPGSAILTLERRGADVILPHDRAWADALVLTCARAGLGLRGVFLSSDGGVRRIA
ncbi:MAG: hypothetical protein QOG20_1667 [Pseudonocardiales bacterium]|jgi:hypothetical protein|nr:hypothetical protein [Pseudonocardiales bacterium]